MGISANDVSLYEDLPKQGHGLALSAALVALALHRFRVAALTIAGVVAVAGIGWLGTHLEPINSMNEARMGGTPETDALWARLSPAAGAAVCVIDAGRLELERARLSPELREAVTEPVYSVRRRFEAWERLGRLLEAGPRPAEFYPFSAYENDLDGRDGLAEVMASLSPAVRAELAGVLDALGARFEAATDRDVTGALDPWLRTARGPAPQAHVWWWRVPKSAPW